MSETNPLFSGRFSGHDEPFHLLRTPDGSGVFISPTKQPPSDSATLDSNAASSRVGSQSGRLLLTLSGFLLESVAELPQLPARQITDPNLASLMSLVSGAGMVQRQEWLVGAVSIQSVEKDVMPEFLGVPHHGPDKARALFDVTYADGTVRRFRQEVQKLVPNFPKDYEVTTREMVLRSENTYLEYESWVDVQLPLESAKLCPVREGSLGRAFHLGPAFVARVGVRKGEVASVVGYGLSAKAEEETVEAAAGAGDFLSAEIGSAPKYDLVEFKVTPAMFANGANLTPSRHLMPSQAGGYPEREGERWWEEGEVEMFARWVGPASNRLTVSDSRERPQLHHGASDLVSYAQSVLKGRWPAAEPVIAKNPVAAWFYASTVIQGRWPEAEAMIGSHPMAAFGYADRVLGGRWVEAEEVIATDACAALNYACNILKSRWLVAEPVIAKEPRWGFRYACDVVKGRWTATEETMLSQPELCCPDSYAGRSYIAEYALNVVKGRWIEAEPVLAGDQHHAASYEAAMKSLGVFGVELPGDWKQQALARANTPTPSSAVPPPAPDVDGPSTALKA